MRTPERWAVAVRRPDTSLHVEAHEIRDRWPRLRRSPLRGPLALVDAVRVGTRALRVAVRESSRVEVPPDQLGLTLLPVLVGVLAVFVVAPGLLAAGWTGWEADLGEAAMRGAVLVLYLVLVARSEQARRMFGYHGAEHMVIAAHERSGEKPDLAGARNESPVHHRCGSSFMALFVIASGVAYSFVPRLPLWAGGLLRVALLPVVAALAYEVMRVSARWQDEPWARALSWPGRLLQRITTRHPDDEQIEVALAAFAAATRDEPSGG